MLKVCETDYYMYVIWIIGFYLLVKTPVVNNRQPTVTGSNNFKENNPPDGKDCLLQTLSAIIRVNHSQTSKQTNYSLAMPLFSKLQKLAAALVLNYTVFAKFTSLLTVHFYKISSISSAFL